MTTMQLALIGNGRMGQAIALAAGERGHQVRTVVEGRENHDGMAITRERMAGVDVALEFTRPDQAPLNLLRLARLGIPAVSGTTGWSDRFAEVTREVATCGSALLHSPNFSIGAQLFLQAAADLAQRFADRAEFDGYLLDQHHALKRDVPSGTALRLRAVVKGVDPGRPFPISSVRAGSTPGSHTVAYDSPHELIRLEHVARGRQAFADGALRAAEWVRGRNGVFTFEEMLFGGER